MSRFGQFCDRFIEAGWLVALALVPLYINFFSTRGYSVGKAYLLRVVVLFMAAAYLMKLAEIRDVGSLRSAATSLWKNPLWLAVGAYLLALCITTATSVSPALSLRGSFLSLQGTFTNLTYIALFCLLALNLRTREQLDRAVTALLFSSVPIAFYAVVQESGWDPLVYLGATPDTIKWRARSTMGNHLFLAAYLIMVLPFTGSRLVEAIHDWRRDPSASASAHGAVLLGVGTILLQILFLAAFLLSSRTIKQIWWATLPVLLTYLFLIIWTLRLSARIPPLGMVVAYSALTALQAVALVFTQARGPWLGLLAGMALFSILIALRWNMRRALIGMLGSALLLGIFVAVLNIPQGPLQPLKRSVLLARLGSLSAFESAPVKFRLVMWDTVGFLLWSHPAVGSPEEPLRGIRPLVGYGPETLGLTVEKVLPPSLGRSDRWQRVHAQARNELLQHLAEGGLLGLGAFLLLLLAFYRMTLMALWQSQERAQQLYLVALIAAMTAHLVELQFGVAVTPTRMLFWAFLALALFVSQPLPPAADAKSQGRDLLWRSWMIPYAALTLSLMVLVGNTMRVGAIKPGLLIGFGGLLVGMVFLALELPASGRYHRARQQRIWLHGVIAGVAALLIYHGAFRPLVAHAYFTFAQFGGQMERVLAFQKAVSTDPSEDTYHAALGRSLMDLGLTLLAQKPDVKIPDGFRPTAHDARAIHPVHFGALGGQGVLALADLSYQEARRLQPLDPRHAYYHARLNHLWGLRGRPERLDTALRYYQEVAEMSPNRILVWVNLGLVHVAKGQPQQALERIHAAQSLGYDSWLIHYALAVTYRQMGNSKLALKEAELAGRSRGRKEKTKRLPDQLRDQGESLLEGAEGN